MNIHPALLILWGVITLALIAVLIYRATLTQHETDQLFLTEQQTVSASHVEHDRIVDRVNHLRPICRGLWAATIVMTVLIAGLYLAQVLPNM